MGIDLLDTLTSLQGAELIFELFLSFVLAIYLIFAFLMVMQIRLLNKSFSTEASFLLMSFAFSHFFATLLLLLFTVATIF